ncbi:MAG: hypothetical protein GC206_15950 [Alphaproteobacteria bacterium]|nr:hypothetical protein [Alphaproteobacteria bacterium]
MEALASARLGMAQALARFDRAGAAVVRATTAERDVEPVQAISEMLEAKHEFRANVQVALIADEMMDALLELQREPK